MKKTSDFKSKILLSTSASILLGLILSNPRLAKADSLSADQDNQSDSPATRTVNPNKAGKNTARETDQNNQLNSSATPVTRSMSSDEVEENNAVNTADSQASSTGISKIDSQTNSAGTNVTRSASPHESKLVTGNLVMDTEERIKLKASYDFETDELTIFGGTYSGYYRSIAKGTLWDQYNDPYYVENAKKIKIVGKISPTGESVASPFDNMFAGFKYLTEIEGLDNLETTNVTSYDRMFADCVSLTSLDLSLLDIPYAERLNGMFANCANLVNISFGSINTSNCQSMDYMFDNCKKLTHIDLSKFDTSTVYSMRGMFRNAESLVYVNLSSFDVRETNEMSNMFEGCSSLINLDLSN